MALSALSGFLSNRKGARTSTFNRTNRFNETSRRTPTLSPQLQGLQDRVVGDLNRRFDDPAAGTGRLKAQARENVNTDFRGTNQRLADTFLSFQGGGKSGKFGQAAIATEVGRRGALAGVESDFARFILERQDQNLSLAERLLALSQGSEVTTTGENVSSGQAVAAGSGAAGALNSSLETAATLFALDQLLRDG